MSNEEQAYDAAGEALVDWVDTHKDTVDEPMLCTLLLDKAIDVCFFCLGPDKALEAVDNMVREKIRKYSEDPSNN